MLVVQEYPQSGPRSFTIWRSADGLAWEQAPVDSSESVVMAASHGPLGSIFATPTTLLLSADDGVTWSETPQGATFEADTIYMLAQTPDGHLLAGTMAQKGGKNHVAMWVGTPTP